MTRSAPLFLLAAMTAAMLALPGCSTRDEAANDTTAATTGVTRTEVVAEQPPVTPMAAATVIQSQPGPAGSQVDLLKLAVTGDILTATFRCSSDTEFNSKMFEIPEISIIDDATSQRIAVLKDNNDKWLASNTSGNYIATSCTKKPGVFWAKFPAPPATSKTVSINLPETAPFDGVPVTR